MITIQLRFYEELNDFLPLEKRKIGFYHSILPETTIKEIVESFGVPEKEIDRVLANGKLVNLDYPIQSNDFISFFPAFKTFHHSQYAHLHTRSVKKTRFIMDIPLGVLTKYLRLLGFDALYEHNFSPDIILLRSKEENRIALTYNTKLLKNNTISDCHIIQGSCLDNQVEEVLNHFDLYDKCDPFTRCMICNELLKKIDAEKEISPQIHNAYERLTLCKLCNRLHWEKSLYAHLKAWVNTMVPKRRPDSF